MSTSLPLLFSLSMSLSLTVSPYLRSVVSSMKQQMVEELLLWVEELLLWVEELEQVNA